MRKLVVSALVSLDGVTESPWEWSRFDDECTELSLQVLHDCDAFVMGRVTYDDFHAAWAGVTDDPYIERINAMPKYVASRTLDDVTWNATLLGPDIVAALRQIKAEPGKDLIKYGLSRVDDTLLRAGLVDELRVWVMPVVVGTGRHLFEDIDTSALDLTLTDTRRLANGSVILKYTPAIRARA